MRRAFAALVVALSLGGILTVGVPVLEAATDNSVVEAVADVDPAAAVSWYYYCYSGYVRGPVVAGSSLDNAAANAAKAVWTQRYGNFGGWIVTYISSGNNHKYVNGYRPGTALNVAATCYIV